MKSHILRMFVLLSVCALLAACGSSETQAPTDTTTVTGTPTENPTKTPTPTENPTDAPTPTENPTDTPTPTENPTDTPTPTETPHEHKYSESVTKEVTCTENGVKTFTCECGDSYTEDISATGHQFGAYQSDNNATYTADGTETATCSLCGKTDTRTLSGSKKEYTFTDKSATMWATDSVNVRNLPSTDGSKVGSLSKDQEVNITGVCNETGWYRFNYDDETAYVSDKYLSNTKPQASSQSQSNTSFPYPLYTHYRDNRGFLYFYGHWGGKDNMSPEILSQTEEAMDIIREDMFSKGIYDGGTTWSPIGTYAEGYIVVRFVYLASDDLMSLVRDPNGYLGIPIDQ